MPSVLTVKLGSCLTGPTKAMVRDLREVANQCNAIRNLAERWLYEHAERTIDFCCDNYGAMSAEDTVTLLSAPNEIKRIELKLSGKARKRKPKPLKNGKPRKEKTEQELRADVVRLRKSLEDLRAAAAASRAKKLIGIARVERRKELIEKLSLANAVELKNMYKPSMVDLFPHVSSALVSACCQDVTQRAAMAAPWKDNSGVKRRVPLKRWQAVMLGECNQNNWSALRVPILAGMNCVSKLRHNEFHGDYELDFPLWSKQSPREHKRCRVRLLVREHSDGNRHLVQRIANEPKTLFKDSELIYDHDKRFWQLNLTYETPNYPPRDRSRVAELLMAPNTSTKGPLVIMRDEGRPWWCGRNGKYIVRLEEFRTIKKKVVGLRYRDAERDSLDGHGRGRVYDAARAQTRACRDANIRFRRELLRDVVKFCKLNGIGTLVYREPSIPLRDASWFALNGVGFAWSMFSPALVAKLATIGTVVEVKSHRLAEWCERWGIEPKAAFARVSETVTDTGVGDVLFRGAGGEAGHHKAPLAKGVAERAGERGSEDGGAVDG